MSPNAQNPSDCGCNDYSLQVANTGIGAVTVANPNLDGTGTTVSVFTARDGGKGGYIIKSITIKAIQPALQGMIRIFISNNVSKVITLYKEVVVPIVPQAASVPVPTPQYIMFETVLCGDLKLNPGFSLLAATQNAQSFNVIVEGLDWGYPVTLPGTCCNFEQDAANTGVGVVSVANANLNGTGAIITIFQAGATLTATAAGALIKAITIKALQSTHEGAVRIFVSPDGTAWTLMQEAWIPQTTQSGFDPSFKAVLNENLHIPSGYQLGVTTQISQSFAVTVEGDSWIYPGY